MSQAQVSHRPSDLTVAEIGQQFRDGTLTPTCLVESLLEQVRRLEPTIGAWTTLDEDHLIEAARQAGLEMAQHGMRSPLHGIPIGVKDIFYTSGVRTTMGSPIFADFVPRYDATVVARLKQAGAIVMGKTVTTQFASLHPAGTRNPWNTEHTPGGSSSGSGAAVAAHMCPAALGSQTGGSVIRPAAYTGTVGLKPTHGLISLFGVFPVAWSLDTVGVLTRSVEDAALLLQELAGYDRYDSESLNAPSVDYLEASLSLERPPRIGLLKQFFFVRANADVTETVDDACETLAGAGAIVEEADLPKLFQDALDAQSVLQNVESAVVHKDIYPKHKELYGQKVRDQIEGGYAISAVTYAAAKQLQPEFANEVAATLAPFDVLLAPATDVPAPRGLESTGDPLFQRAWTYAGVPAITLPAGLSAEGLPVGIQLIGRKLDEGRLLAVARWCEEMLGWELAPPLA